jgi:hypothetical protein
MTEPGLTVFSEVKRLVLNRNFYRFCFVIGSAADDRMSRIHQRADSPSKVTLKLFKLFVRHSPASAQK